MKREIGCPVHFLPLGSPQGCSHFQYSHVSHSEVVCLSHWQIGLTADAAQCQRQNCHSLENIDFVKSGFCCLSSPSHVNCDVSPQSLPSSQQQTNLSVAYLSSSGQCWWPTSKLLAGVFQAMMEKVVLSVLPHHVLMSVVILKHFSLNSSHSDQQ